MGCPSGSSVGIGAEIADGVLYIWGSNPAWTGRGLVTLSGVAAGGRSGSVAIPAAAFSTDRTLPGPSGHTDYYVPWSPRLDINRISSAKEHARRWGRESQSIDDGIQWSRWTPLTFMRAVNCGCRWVNASTFTGWTTDLQYKTVDCALDELQALHVDWLKIDPPFFMTTLQSNEVIRMYDFSGLPSWTDEDIAYVVSEAHRRGISVMGSLQLWPLNNGTFYGAGRQEMRPADWDSWLGSYAGVVRQLVQLYARLGVEMICPGVELFNLSLELTGRPYLTDTQWNASMVGLVAETRDEYPGPVTWAPVALPPLVHSNSAYNRMLPLLLTLDVLGINAYPWPLTSDRAPTLDTVRAGWGRYRDDILNPLIARIGKAYIFTEVASASCDGSLIRPQNTPPTTPLDLEEQRLFYRACIDTFFDDPRFRGAFWWEYSLTGAFAVGDPGGVTDRGLAFRLKPAQDEIERAYGDGGVMRRAVQIDGLLADWRAEWLVASDQRGDAAFRSAPDVSQLYAVMDRNSLFLRVSFANQVATADLGGALFFIDLNGDAIPEYKITFGITAGNGVVCLQYPFASDRPSVGNGDGVFTGSDIELSMPLVFLGGIEGPVRVAFGIHWVTNGQFVWIDALGYPDGAFFGPVARASSL